MLQKVFTEKKKKKKKNQVNSNKTLKNKTYLNVFM